MKRSFLPFVIIAMWLFSSSVFSQSKSDTASLGLPGDNLNLTEVLDIFQKSKTIEAFEKTLNDDKKRVSNLDLDLDKKVDFIKVVTKKDGDVFTFILQIAVSKEETQDVAIIVVEKDKNKKVTIQIIGDEDLYGKNYVIEPKPTDTPAQTVNPGYTGSDPILKSTPATTTIVVESAPIVQYVYSPAYVPYYPPYYYGYYPPYFAFGAAIAVGIYRSNHYYGGYGYHGGGNTVVINNNRNYVNHNNSRNSSTSVRNNMNNGNYGNGNRPSNGVSGGNKAGVSNNMSNRPSTGASAGNNKAGVNNNMSNNNRSSSSNRSSQPSSRSNMSTQQSRPSSNSMGSMGSSRSSMGSMGGGRSMGGGGGGGGGRRR